MTAPAGKTLALLVPDGVGVRNFLIGPFLRQLPRHWEAHAFHSIPEAFLPIFQEGLNGSVHWQNLQDYRPDRLTLGLQYSLGYAQMYWARTKSMQHILAQPIRGSWKNRALNSTAKLLGRWSAGPSRMQLLEKAHCEAASHRPETRCYAKAFGQIHPDVVFSTNQRPSQVLPAVLAAQSEGIPCATFIFSWDNLSSKGRIIAPFDYYLVWSNHMRSELLHYYPHIKAQQVHVVGTPQFEPYGDPALLWTREEFFERIGADPTRKLICYSGGDAGTCPEDPKHVEVLMGLIRDGHIAGDPQVIVRPVPVDDGTRYLPARHKYPELIWAQPEWVHTEPGNWSKVIPTPADVQFLANLTQHVDLNINLGSTMTLDFGIHDKPVVNVAFDVADPPIFGMPVWDYYYFFEHYRPVVALGAARPARSPEELAEHVNTYLANPSLDREGRRRLLDMQVTGSLCGASGRIHEVLDAIAVRK
ncbi:MAG: hypothetical protein JNK87_26360 [Bryobacterales bacterium]|nr:hypothetical protein [Bryobacterales bacterium]